MEADLAVAAAATRKGETVMAPLACSPTGAAGEAAEAAELVAFVVAAAAGELAVGDGP